jgi:type IV secretion system protein VirB9
MRNGMRWLTSPANSGTSDRTSPHVIIKPTDENISTNMIITTDKRTYYLFLTSKRTGYITRLSFYYPHDIVQNWQNAKLIAKEQESQKIAQFPNMTAQNLDFDYEITGNNKLLKPVRVFNDGKHVYLQMNKELSSQQAPILMIIGADNQTQLVNYRIKNDYYIVDRLFEKADLIIGVGRNQEKIRITKNKLKTCFYNCN